MFSFDYYPWRWQNVKYMDKILRPLKGLYCEVCQRSAFYFPQARFGLPHVFVNKVVFKTATHSFTYFLCLFSCNHKRVEWLTENRLPAKPLLFGPLHKKSALRQSSSIGSGMLKGWSSQKDITPNAPSTLPLGFCWLLLYFETTQPSKNSRSENNCGRLW